MIYHIIEVANTHAGSVDYVYDLLNEFKDFTQSYGIKFQPFKYDCIATKDYHHYRLYQDIFFEPVVWKKIIKLASETKDIWLDIFDSYSIDVFMDNFEFVKGIKIQSSVLNNKELILKLSKLDLSDKKVIINLSGFSLKQLKSIIDDLNSQLKVFELILQFGYQDYPTLVEDSNLYKLKEIILNFPDYKISFADHSPGDSDDAIYLPILAMGFGASIIEKHVMHSQLFTKYDAFSSMTIDKYKVFIEKLKQYQESIFSNCFVSTKEKLYLDLTIQKPLLNTEKNMGESIFNTDLMYKRSNKPGIDIFKLNELLSSGHVLQRSKCTGDSLLINDFKKATVATVIACRMKSSRLKRKALLKFGGLTSIEHCIKNALNFSNINYTILATSTEEEDAILEKYTYSDSVIFHRGHPTDVIDRYLEICDVYKIDIVIRVTGDMPFISDEIKTILLESHFKTGADYTTANEAAIGTNLEIINVSALRKIKRHFKSFEYSEYMTFYFKNNPGYFNCNFVELPSELIRDYRLTLDYQLDLDMFDLLIQQLNSKNLEINLANIFECLDLNPEIKAINQGCNTLYKTDADLINKLNEVTKIAV